MRFAVANLRSAFAIFVVIGAAVIFTLSQVAEENEGRRAASYLILMSLVLALMVLFGIIIWMRSQWNLALETDGETFYYLGFIYTLLTLIATFTPFLIEGTKPSTQQVLGLFGLGLITTFVGLSGRIFFLQATHVDSIDQDAQRLSRAYVEASKEIEKTSVQIRRVASELEDTSKKTHATFAESLEKATQKISVDFQRIFEETNKRITNITENTAVHVSTLLRKSAEAFAITLGEFQKRLEALKLPPAELGERLHAQIEKLISAAESATKTAALFESQIINVNKELAKVGPEAATVAGGFTEITSAMEETTKSLQMGTVALSRLGAQSDSTNKSLASIVPSVDLLGSAAQLAGVEISAIPHHVVRFNSAMDGLAGSVQNVTPALAGFGAVVAAVSERISKLVSALSGIEELVRKVAETQKKVSVELVRGVEILKSHQEVIERLAKDLQQDLVASEEALKKVHLNLVSATNFVTSEIQKKSG